jgi:hypothetical protein
MRTAICAAGLAAVTVICAIDAADPTPAETAARVAGVQRRLPWFWSPTTEGLTDIPYTYEVLMTRRVTNRGGKEIAPHAGSPLANWRSLRLERIPLDFGSFMRCLATDDKSPCSDEWTRELEREAKKRDALTAEDRARIDATREQRRERRRNFWDDFPDAMRLENAGANQLRFAPRPGYKPQRGVHNGMLTAISGTLWFDDATGEVTRMEYDLVHDVDEPFLRYQKGARYEISLARSADQHYLPEHIRERYQVPKTERLEDRTTVFTKFRKFESESKIEFGDPKKQ